MKCIFDTSERCYCFLWCQTSAPSAAPRSHINGGKQSMDLNCYFVMKFFVFFVFFLLSHGQKCVIFLWIGNIIFLNVVEEAKVAQIMGSSSFIFRYFACVMVQWGCHQEGHVRELLQDCCWFMKSAKTFMFVFLDMLRKGSDKTTARVTGPI